MEKKILVVDDDKAVVSSLSALLTKSGYSVTASYDGNDALTKISKGAEFDLIICDIRLPQINGVDTIGRIKQYLKDNNKPEIPVIFITGYADADLNKLAQEIGNLYLKPFDNKELLEGVRIEIERVPHDAKLNYNKNFVEERRQWLSEKSGVKFSHISSYSIEPEDCRGNIENFIGTAQIPLGVFGPLTVNGIHAKGTYYVPFATTEGALLSTYQRGAIAITKSGGARVSIHKDENHLDPVFILKNLEEAENFVKWISNNFQALNDKVKEVTEHGKLISITPYIMGRRVALRVSYYTQDAMGANMISIATDRICRFISAQFKIEKYLLRSNLSSEKKASGVNMLIGYGKEISVEAVIPRKIVTRHLNSSPEAIHSSWHTWALGCFHANTIGANAHFANGLAAIFIACGQDPAHVTNASVGITIFEMLESGDLYTALKLPNIMVGTVGGGTALGTQRECLEIIGCYGKGKSKKFAEIVAASLLAGEIGICAGITSDEFLKPHVEARAHTRDKAFDQ